MAASIVDALCRDLMLEREHLEELLSNPSDCYKSFVLGGRRIDAPRLDLKYVQRWILDFVRAETAELPSFVTAYESGRSVVANAELHRENQHILVMDIKHFFRSCTKDKVAAFFAGMRLRALSSELTTSDVLILTKLVTHKGSLPMGSPSSPAIANRIMAPVDRELISELGGGFTYSRYSDDICVSSADFIDVASVVRLVREALIRYGFEVNNKKVRCMGCGDARRVTGIYIEPDGTLSIGAKRKRELNAMIYRFLVHGEGNASVIRGHIDFARSVNPAYVTDLLLKYENYGVAAKFGGVMGALVHGGYSL